LVLRLNNLRLFFRLLHAPKIGFIVTAAALHRAH
jgi:hypothetical protein